MNKALKKLLPTLALIVVTAALMGTSTFAWFTMNTQVKVDGMKVEITTYNNLLIAPENTADGETKWSNDEKLFVNKQTFDTTTKLAPVSSVDGVNFYYITNKNATAAGTKITGDYLEYDASDTTSTNSFAKQYPSREAYVDYNFQLKAINGDEKEDTTNAMELRLTQLDLKYSATTTDELELIKAFRVAVFIEEVESEYPDNTSENHVKNFENVHAGDVTDTLLSIYTPEDAENFSKEIDSVNKAVGSTGLKDVSSIYNKITSADTGYMATVAEDKTNYYKVTIRLWIEGEDTTCFNEAYITLDEHWELLVAFDLVEYDSDLDNVDCLGMTAVTVTP